MIDLKDVGVIVIKRLLIILLGVMLLVACGNDESKVDEPEDDVSAKKESTQETINEQEHNIVLVDNDDLMITLLDSEHVRVTDYEDKDIIILNLGIENKQNRTFKIGVKDISIDGRSEDYDIGLNENEIGPEEQIMNTANFSINILDDNKELSFEEHLSGTFRYSDFEGNRNEISFSEYINE